VRQGIIARVRQPDKGADGRQQGAIQGLIAAKLGIWCANYD
jgi:hypothetical protein